MTFKVTVFNKKFFFKSLFEKLFLDNIRAGVTFKTLSQADAVQSYFVNLAHVFEI